MNSLKSLKKQFSIEREKNKGHNTSNKVQPTFTATSSDDPNNPTKVVVTASGVLTKYKSGLRRSSTLSQTSSNDRATPRTPRTFVEIPPGDLPNDIKAPQNVEAVANADASKQLDETKDPTRKFEGDSLFQNELFLRSNPPNRDLNTSSDLKAIMGKNKLLKKSAIMNSFFGVKRKKPEIDSVLALVDKVPYDNIVSAIYYEATSFVLTREVKKHLQSVAKNAVFAKLKYTPSHLLTVRSYTQELFNPNILDVRVDDTTSRKLFRSVSVTKFEHSVDDFKRKKAKSWFMGDLHGCLLSCLFFLCSSGAVTFESDPEKILCAYELGTGRIIDLTEPTIKTKESVDRMIVIPKVLINPEFFKNGNSLYFLGDYFDRGKMGIEIICVLSFLKQQLKRLFPTYEKQLVLIFGDHELFTFYDNPRLIRYFPNMFTHMRVSAYRHVVGQMRFMLRENFFDMCALTGFGAIVSHSAITQPYISRLCQLLSTFVDSNDFSLKFLQSIALEKLDRLSMAVRKQLVDVISDIWRNVSYNPVHLSFFEDQKTSDTTSPLFTRDYRRCVSPCIMGHTPTQKFLPKSIPNSSYDHKLKAPNGLAFFDLGVSYGFAFNEGYSHPCSIKVESDGSEVTQYLDKPRLKGTVSVDELYKLDLTPDDLDGEQI